MASGFRQTTVTEDNTGRRDWRAQYKLCTKRWPTGFGRRLTQRTVLAKGCSELLTSKRTTTGSRSWERERKIREKKKARKLAGELDDILLGWTRSLCIQYTHFKVAESSSNCISKRLSHPSYLLVIGWVMLCTAFWFHQKVCTALRTALEFQQNLHCLALPWVLL